MRNTTKRFWMRIVGFCLVLLLGSSTALSVRAAGDKDGKSEGTKIESETAASIRLMKTEGTVAVEKASGKSVKLIKNMKLFDGYHVSTEEKSYAWQELDKTKLIKEDALSEVEIRKSGKVLEVLLNSGNLYFNVTEKLAEDETLNICTSSMIAGIRGTSGWVKVVDSRHSSLYLLEGQVECSVTDPVTGQTKTTVISVGQKAEFTIDNSMQVGDRCEIQVSRFTEEDVPGFVQVELVGDKQRCEKIYSASGIDLRNVTKQEAIARLQEDQEKISEQQREIENQIAQQENNISKDPVWKREITPVKKPSEPQTQTPAQTEPESPAPSVPETPSTPSVPATPSTPDTTQVSVTDPDGISGILATGQDVVVSPDETSNIYQIDSDLHIPSGTTLTVDSGVTMIVGSAATVTVDGTLLAKGDAENEGKIIVNSSESFHITGAMTNRGTIVNQASGLIEAAEGIDNYGAISCDGTSTLYSSSADGTVRMRGTASTLVIAGGDITNRGTGAALALDEASQIGNITFTTDTLLQAVTENVLTVGGQKLGVDSYEVTFDSASNLYQFKIDVKTVTFDGGEGSTVKQVKVITGFAVGSGVPALTKAGYELTGWNTASDGSGESFTAQTVVTEDVTVYAQWSSNETTHTVTLDPNGGTLQTGNLLETVHNGTVELPVPLAPENYAFYGWYTAKDSNGVKVTGAEPITADVTYYARWVPGSTALKVEFCLPGETETVLETQYVVSGGTAVQPADPEKEGYTFEGWYQDSSLEITYRFDTPVTESIRLYAKFAIISYSVTYEAANGEEPYEVSVWHGYTVTAPETDPVKEGYTFIGWYADEACTTLYDFTTPVTEDITIFAGWQLNVYTVTLDAAGGTMTIDGVAGQQKASVSVNHGETATLPEPEQTGYTFLGWYQIDASDPANVIETEYTSQSVITGDLNLTAKWEINVYKVTFEPDNGEDPIITEVEYLQTASRPELTPEKEGYTFTGWYADETCKVPYDFYMAVTEDITIYAGWKLNVYTVTLDAAGGTMTIDGAAGQQKASVSVNHGETAALPEPEKTGYTFLGWYQIDASDPANVIETEYTSQSVITGDLNLTAKWEINVYKVTFEPDNGEDPIITEVEYLQTASRPELTPEKEGYTFTGWYADETCKVPYDFYMAVTEDITIYAGWKLNVYTVTLDAAGGTMTIDGAEGLQTAGVNVNHGETAVLPTPSREGYTFLGWYYYEIEDTNPDAAEVIEIRFTSDKVIMGDLSLTAKWEINVYTVTLQPQNGEEPVEQPVEHGDVVLMPEGWPTPSDSCDLEGWYYENTYETAYVEEPVTKDITLYAKWVCNVELNLGSGYVMVDDVAWESFYYVSVPVGEIPELPEPIYGGFVFDGWYLDEAFEKPYEAGPISEHLTLYANWIEAEL